MKNYIFVVQLFFIFALTDCARPKSAPPAPSLGTETAQAGCQARFETSQNCLSLTWEKSPTPVEDEFEPAQILLKVSRANLGDGSPVAIDPDGDISARLWMTSMGHGTTPFTLQRVDLGTYRATPLIFTMAGDWELIVEIKKGSVIVDRATWTIHL